VSAAPPAIARPALARSLSSRLLGLTALFVMLAEIAIYVPSITRYRNALLDERLSAGHLAVLALEATPDHMVADTLRRELLRHAQAYTVALMREGRRDLALVDDLPPPVEHTIDLGRESTLVQIGRALALLVQRDDRVVQVKGALLNDPGIGIAVVIDEQPLRMALLDYSWRILALSLAISLFTAVLVFFSLTRLIVRPLGAMVTAMAAFRAAPEGPPTLSPDPARQDEIGIAERELARMQAELRLALGQKARLAALGEAVAKIGHDLGNMLATAQLVSDRLAASADPEVKRAAPRLIAAIDRAIALCEATRRFGHAGELAVSPRRFALLPLVEELCAALAGSGRIEIGVEIPPELEVLADRDALYRVLFNLAHNAIEAMAAGGRLALSAGREGERVAIEIADTGAGLPERARANLYRPFAGSARPGGTGLGLAIARELMRAQGGEIVLARSGADGTAFRLSLPA